MCDLDDSFFSTIIQISFITYYEILVIKNLVYIVFDGRGGYFYN